MWWNVTRPHDGEYLMWVDGDEERPLRASDLQLERQLAANGVVGKWYVDVLDQLSRAGTARVKIPKLGQFSQAD
jgi:hypothetical protein